MQLLADFLVQFDPFFTLIGRLWPLWLFFFMLYVSSHLWLAYRQLVFKRKECKKVLLEILIPRELHKNPQAMDQIFSSIHSIKNSPDNLKEKWWDGEVTLWFSFEIVSLGGELYYFMRIPIKHRLMVEAAFYAQYPDIEIIEAHNDYLDRFPSATIEGLQEKGYEFFGNELILQKPDAYPIKTYIEYQSPAEESQLDPISALLETMRKAKPSEMMGVQLLVRPHINDSWKKQGEKIIRELKEKVGRRQVVTPLGEFIMIDRTPGETELLKVIDHNIGRPAFETILRYVYISPREIYSDGFARRGILSAFNQYAGESRNRFRHNTRVWTRTQIWFPPYIFPKRRGQHRKIKMYRNFREARMDEETFMSKVLDMTFFSWGIWLGAFSKYHLWIGVRLKTEMNLSTDELATIYHLPTHIVLTGPLIRRVESRKVGPPAGLPIFGQEGEELPGIK